VSAKVVFAMVSGTGLSSYRLCLFRHGAGQETRLLSFVICINVVISIAETLCSIDFTFSVRALARTRLRICSDIEDLMKRIIHQGETVKAHLLMIQVTVRSLCSPRPSRRIYINIQDGLDEIVRIWKVVVINPAASAASCKETLK
jgi:hypothetical protein